MVKSLAPSYEGIISEWATALLFGMLSIVSFGYLRLLVGRGLKKRVDRILFGIVTLQTIIAGAHMGLCLRQTVVGFLYSGDPDFYFGDNGTQMHVAQTSLYLVNNLIADSILVWRLFVVYGSNVWLCIPFICFICGSLICGFVGVHEALQLHTPTAFYGVVEERWLTTHWVLSITIQVTATILIAWKIWSTRAPYTKHITSSVSMSVIWVILESGAVLSCMTVLLLAFYLAKMEAGAVIISMNAQLSALVPVSILLRVSLKRVKLDNATTLTTPMVVELQGTGRSSGRSNTAVDGEQSINNMELYEYQQKEAIASYGQEAV